MLWLEKEISYNPAYTLTVLLIAGVSGLVIVLSFMVAVFSALNLSQNSQALGLPEGSVRAIIAISLILIFSIQAVYLYGDLSRIQIETAVVTRTQLEAIPIEQIISSAALEVEEMEELQVESDEKLFEVKRRIEKSEESTDFAKQVLTTVSTLVVAIAGFYFGTRAVSIARGEEAPLLPIIRKIVPNQGEQDEEISVEIFGENFQSSPTIKLTHESTEIPGTDPMWSTTKIKCKFKIPPDALTGKWDLYVMNEDGGEDRLAEAFEVKENLSQ
jgi:TRAP-type C4-dicarboxylate transport system permease small subunit